MSLKSRFEGPENRNRLLEALAGQRLVGNDQALAVALADQGVLVHLAPDELLIRQGDWDDDVYFILAGEFQILVNGQPKAVRGPGVHVGELAGIDGARARTATVKALKESLVLKVGLAAMTAISANDVAIWKRVANVVAERLEERNSEIGSANAVPRVFIISSSEAKPVVEQLVLNLDSTAIRVETWDRGTFGISDYPISSLMDAIEASDFTISIVRGDDSLVMRDKASKTARDNVHLEYGISLGVLGRRRSILLVCAGDDLHLPSDLAGLKTLRYREGSKDEVRLSVRTACIEARSYILEEGVFPDRKAR